MDATTPHASSTALDALQKCQAAFVLLSNAELDPEVPLPWRELTDAWIAVQDALASEVR